MAGAALASAAGGAASGLIGGLFGVGTQAMANANTQSLEHSAQDFQSSVYDRVENRFSEAGLPKFMAWTGAGANPMTRYQVLGSNFSNSQIPFQASSSAPIQNSFVSQTTGYSKPASGSNSINSSSRPIPPLQFGGGVDNRTLVKSTNTSSNSQLDFMFPNAGKTVYAPQSRTVGTNTNISSAPLSYPINWGQK